MKVTRVQVDVVRDHSDLLAFCNIVFDHSFIVYNFKVVRGKDGRPFVAMPTRRNEWDCNHCHTKNHTKARWCNQCGKSLPEPPSGVKFYSETSHPLSREFRGELQDAVLQAYYYESLGQTATCTNTVGG